MFKEIKLLLWVVDIHFALTAQWHDKTTHRVLLESDLILCVSDDEIVSRDALDALLGELLEYLPSFELFDV